MSIAVVRSPPADAPRNQPLRIMVVDDSVVIRGLMARWIEAEPDMVIAASLRTGLDAVNQIERVDPDVAVLDIEMPDLDGISALPRLLAKKPNLVVIMASTLTRRNAEISLKALSLGASDYIPKPESTRERDAAETFRRDLIEKIRNFGARRRHSAPVGSLSQASPTDRDRGTHLRAAAPPRPVLRTFSAVSPRVLLIGSSTGGPQALISMVAGLGPVLERVPVLITQHMPPTFTTILAEHLARSSGRPAHEGVDGEPVKSGHIYLAPGGRHLRVARHGGGGVIALDDGPPINFCKPAVDPLFASAIEVWQGAILAVVLTGMGSDGTRGGKDIVAAGGSVIAQDEATSVVWGMPGSAVNAGICSAILPLGEIAPTLNWLVSGDRS